MPLICRKTGCVQEFSSSGAKPCSSQLLLLLSSEQLFLKCGTIPLTQMQPGVWTLSRGTLRYISSPQRSEVPVHWSACPSGDCSCSFCPSEVETDFDPPVTWPPLISVRESLLFSDPHVSAAPHWRLQTLSSDVGSDPPLRCCLLAESTHTCTQIHTHTQTHTTDTKVSVFVLLTWTLSYGFRPRTSNLTHVRLHFWMWTHGSGFGIKETNDFMTSLSCRRTFPQLLDGLSENQPHMDGEKRSRSRVVSV